MAETITEIREFVGEVPPESYYGREDGFHIHTTDQIITLAIDAENYCCESWGYFLTEDDPDKFIGAELLGVEITDTNRTNRVFIPGWLEQDVPDGKIPEYLDEGDVMFVDIRTSRGVLQFVAYNLHNGYYGHSARVSSKQLDYSVSL